VHDAPVAGDDQSGPGPDRVEQRPQGRGERVEWALLTRDRAVPLEVELVDAAVAPDLLRLGGELGGLETLEGGPPQVAEPSGPGQGRGGVAGELAQL